MHPKVKRVFIEKNQKKIILDKTVYVQLNTLVECVFLIHL